MGHGSWVRGHGLWVMGYGSGVMGHGSWVRGHGSGVMGHGSWVGLVAEPASPEPDVCPALPALVVKSMESHLCA